MMLKGGKGKIRAVVEDYDRINGCNTVMTSIDKLPITGLYSVTLSSAPDAGLLEHLNRLPLAESVSVTELSGGQCQLDFMGSPYSNRMMRYVHRKWNDITRHNARKPVMLLNLTVVMIVILLTFFTMATWALQILYDTWLRPF